MLRTELPWIREDAADDSFRGGMSLRRRPPVLVVGAGPTGLSAAYHLGEDAELVEKNPTVGGRCRSVLEGGFTFDYSENALFSEGPDTRSLSGRLLGDNLHWQVRRVAVFREGAVVPIPLVGEFEDAARTKLWKVPLESLEPAWPAVTSVPAAGAHFGYPIDGGFQAVMDGFLPMLARRPRLKTALTGLSLDDRVATLSDGTQLEYEALISTMPLPELVQMVRDQAPASVREAAEGLRHVALRRIHVGVGRDALTDQHVIEFPNDAIFHRVIAQGNASPAAQPAGAFGLTFEITHHAGAPLPAEGLPLVRRCIEDAQRVGLIRRDDPIRVATQTDLPCAFAIPERGRAERVGQLRTWFERYGVHLAGPGGEWTSADGERAMRAGRAAAVQVRQVGAPLGVDPSDLREVPLELERERTGTGV